MTVEWGRWRVTLPPLHNHDVYSQIARIKEAGGEGPIQSDERALAKSARAIPGLWCSIGPERGWYQRAYGTVVVT